MSNRHRGAAVTLRRAQRRTKLQQLVEFVLALVTSYLAARMLARLSGTALWVPAEWRDSVDALVGAFGATVFVATRRLSEIIQHRPTDTNDQETESGRKVFFQILVGSAICIFISIFFLAVFMWLRSKCVVAFDARDWLARQDARNVRDVMDAKPQSAGNRFTHRPTSIPTAEDVQKQVKLAHRILESDKPEAELGDAYRERDPAFQLYKPEFVDLHNQKVYLPYKFPKDIQDYINEVSANYDGIDGVTFMLAHEPDHLFDMIEKQAHWEVAATDWAFLGLDVLIIFFFAVGTAGSFELPSTLGDVLARWL